MALSMFPNLSLGLSSQTSVCWLKTPMATREIPKLLKLFSHLQGYNLAGIINVFHCTEHFQDRNDVKQYYTAAFVIQGDLQSQAMVRAVARQVCEQLIQGKYADGSYAPISRIHLFLPQLLINRMFFRASMGICPF